MSGISYRGGYFKTTVFKISVFWKTEGDFLDSRVWSNAGNWIRINDRWINKRQPHEVAERVASEIPSLAEVIVDDYSGKSAKWVKE